MKASDVIVAGIAGYILFKLIQNREGLKESTEGAMPSAPRTTPQVTANPSAPALPYSGPLPSVIGENNLIDAQKTTAQTPTTAKEYIDLNANATKLYSEQPIKPSPVNAIQSNTQTPAFHSLKKESQDILLRNFSRDYTTPRMLDDDAQYAISVKAANATGTPCAWTQYVSSICGPSSFERMCFLSDQMLSVFESGVLEGMDISDARETAIRHAIELG